LLSYDSCLSFALYSFVQFLPLISAALILTQTSHFCCTYPHPDSHSCIIFYLLFILIFSYLLSVHACLSFINACIFCRVFAQVKHVKERRNRQNKVKKKKKACCMEGR
jgi:predicted membrane protein